MNLRPRYSLLTLLILTALVAGGVKYWYRLQHVVLLYPDPVVYSPHQPSEEQEKLLRRMPLQPSFHSNQTLEYRLEYADLQRRDITFIRGHALAPLDLIYSLEPQGPYGRDPWVIEKYRPPEYQLQLFPNQQVEAVHCWVFKQLNSKPLDLRYHYTYHALQFHWPEFEFGADPLPVYLVTKSGTIFDLQCPKHMRHQLQPLPLASIPAGPAHDVLSRELQTLGM